MNRSLVLLATVLAPFFFSACSPYEPVAEMPPQPVSTSARVSAPPVDVHEAPAWPLGVAP